MRFPRDDDKFAQGVHNRGEGRAQWGQRVHMSDPLDPTVPQTPALDREGLHLLVFESRGPKSHRVPPGGALTIGRAEDCDVRVETPLMSRRHFTVRDSSPPIVEDLGGVNGTLVNGQPLSPRTPTTVERGSLVGAGGVFFTLQDHGLHAQAAAPPARPVVSAVAGVVVEEPAMARLHELVAQVARSDIPVLVVGETGAGKEIIAAAVHRTSARAEGPYVVLNCAALAESLLESELFGYEKGAFTGATQAKRGLIEAADGGSVLLDEIGEMPLATQAKLLRALENGELVRVGAVKPQRVDVRFIAATNRDLPAMVREGRFRRDFYYRLNGITIPVPPLRQRRAEIAPLARYFLAQAAGRMGRTAPMLAPAVVAILEAHAWPGNVRELKHVVDRAVALCRGDELQIEHVILDAEPAGEPARSSSPTPPPSPAPQNAGRLMRLDPETERRLIVEALEQAGGHQGRAAEILGISRRTLISRLDEYGVKRPRKR
jgi:transcriptional regulator with GAF, ATPase, and Fis domain